MGNTLYETIDELRGTIDALRENVKEKETYIAVLTQENLDLKVDIGRYRAIIKAVAFVAQKAIKMKLI